MEYYVGNKVFIETAAYWQGQNLLFVYREFALAGAVNYWTKNWCWKMNSNFRCKDCNNLLTHK